MRENQSAFSLDPVPPPVVHCLHSLLGTERKRGGGLGGGSRKGEAQEGPRAHSGLPGPRPRSRASVRRTGGPSREAPQGADGEGKRPREGEGLGRSSLGVSPFLCGPTQAGQPTQADFGGCAGGAFVGRPCKPPGRTPPPEVANRCRSGLLRRWTPFPSVAGWSSGRPILNGVPDLGAKTSPETRKPTSVCT
jgi:hypothetical protein